VPLNVNQPTDSAFYYSNYYATMLN